MCDHFFNLWTFVAAALEILADAVFKTDGFADVDDLISGIVHDVDAGFTGEFFEFFGDVEFLGHMWGCSWFFAK